MPGAGGLSGMPDARRGRFIRDAGFFTCAPPPPRRPSTAMVRRDSGSSAGSSSSPRDVDGTVACVPSFEALCEAVKREASEYGQGQGPFAIACEGRQLVCGGSIEEKRGTADDDGSSEGHMTSLTSSPPHGSPTMPARLQCEPIRLGVATRDSRSRAGEPDTAAASPCALPLSAAAGNDVCISTPLQQLRGHVAKFLREAADPANLREQSAAMSDASSADSLDEQLEAALNDPGRMVERRCAMTTRGRIGNWGPF